jgi:5-methylthioadenosine/S-adenosylhomocysteine deaminase
MRDAARQVIRRNTIGLAASLAFAEMISSGTTTAVDMYYFPEELAEAAVAAGFRLVTGPVFVASPGPDQVAPAERLAHGREFMQAYRDHPLILPCVMPHSPYDCPPEILASAWQLAGEYDALLSTHAAETHGEVAHVQKQHGATPVELLDRLGMLAPRTILAHCVHLTPAEIALLAKRQATVAHCPLSNVKLGDGIAPVAEYQRAGVRVTLGTDGPASSNDLNLWGIMRLAAVLQRGKHEDPSLTPARSIVRAATCEAARALGLGERLGSLEAGKLADFILLDRNRAHMAPMYDPYSHLVYAAGRDDVVTVVINGKIVLRDRRLTTLDEDQLVADVRAVTRTIGAY